MAPKYDAIIIGAGYGGIVCGALLSKWGVKVLVLDKNNRPGGKQMPFTKNGFKGEWWPTFGIPLERGPFVEAFAELGIESNLKLMPGSAALMYRRPSGKWVTAVDSPKSEIADPTENMFNAWQLNAEERQTSLQILAELALMSPQELDPLDDVPIKDWVDSHTNVPPALRGFFAVHANLMATNLYELVAASEMARIMQIFAGTTKSYPKGGYGRLIMDLVNFIKAHGGDVQLRSRVERILVEGGRAAGVTCNGKVFKAPIIVSNAGVQPTVLKLLGEEYFDKFYVNYVKEIVPSLGFTCQRYVMSKPVLEHGVYIATSEDSYIDAARLDDMHAGKFPDVISVYGTVPAHFDPEMAPPGKQMLLIGTWCSPDPAAREIRALQKKVDEQFEEMLPDAARFVETREGYVGPAHVAAMSRDQVLPGLGGEAVGLAVTVGYCGKNKPKARSPLPGLFFVGHDAGGSALVGTHQAVSSGMRVAHLVRNYYFERKLVERL